MEKYQDRYQAGKVLASQLADYANNKNVIVLALPRGGVPVAYEISQALHIPLDVFVVRKLGLLTHKELAMGAIATGGMVVFNEDVISSNHISQSEIAQVITEEQQELDRRNLKYRGDKPFPELINKVIILVDDGIATGATIRSAIQAIKKQHPAKLIVAVPVAAYDTCQEIESTVDQLICPLRPVNFYAVGAWYEDFSQTEDDEVYRLLAPK